MGDYFCSFSSSSDHSKSLSTRGEYGTSGLDYYHYFISPAGRILFFLGKEHRRRKKTAGSSFASCIARLITSPYIVSRLCTQTIQRFLKYTAKKLFTFPQNNIKSSDMALFFSLTLSNFCPSPSLLSRHRPNLP